MLAGMVSGLVTAVLQTRMGVNSLLAGIVVNTGLYSINIAVMEGSSLKNLNKTTVFQLKVQKPSEDAVLSNDTINVTVEIAPEEE